MVNMIFKKLLDDYPDLNICRNEIYNAYYILKACYEKKGLVMVCGSGGSASDSEHIVGELMKGFNLKRPLPEEEKMKFSALPDGEHIAASLQSALPAISLVSQTSLMTAFANDVSADLVFAQQVYAYAKNNFDVLIAMSTSGNSKNVVLAAETAKAAGIKTVAITGEKNSALTELADVTIKIPRSTPYEVQEFTLPVYHAICAMLEAAFFDIKSAEE